MRKPSNSKFAGNASTVADGVFVTANTCGTTTPRLHAKTSQ